MMSDFKSNIKLNYLYRDAGNYKIFGCVVFSNPDRIEINKIQNEIRSKLIDGEFFIPSKWNLTPLHFEEWNEKLDHFWNEFESVQQTKEEPTTYKSITKFLEDIA